MVIEPSNTSNVVNVLSMSRISKGNANGAFKTCEGSYIAATKTERGDLTSRFVYIFWLLKEAQSPCWPHSSTGMPAIEVAEAEPIRPDWGPYWSLKLLRSKPKYTSEPKRKVAQVFRVFNRYFHRSSLTRIYSNKTAIETTKNKFTSIWIRNALKSTQ